MLLCHRMCREAQQQYAERDLVPAPLAARCGHCTAIIRHCCSQQQLALLTWMPPKGSWCSRWVRSGSS